MISIKIWETLLSRHANCSLPVAVHVSKTRVLKLPNIICTRALGSRENLSKQHGGDRGGNFAASKFISSFSPESTTSSASKPKETAVLRSKNTHEETRT